MATLQKKKNEDVCRERCLIIDLTYVKMFNETRSSLFEKRLNKH